MLTSVTFSSLVYITSKILRKSQDCQIQTIKDLKECKVDWYSDFCKSGQIKCFYAPISIISFVYAILISNTDFYIQFLCIVYDFLNFRNLMQYQLCHGTFKRNEARRHEISFNCQNESRLLRKLLFSDEKFRR